LEVFVKVSKILGKNVRMLVQGTLSYDKEIFSQEKVRQSLVKEGVNPENYQHVFNGQIVNYESIWDTLRKIDVLLFPSVSSVESFGRVLVEAGHAGCTVISSNHAAAPEILESNNLVDVEFSRKMFDLRNVSSLGRIDVDEMVDKCCNHEKLSKKFNNNYSNAENFLKILKNSPISVPNKICKKIEEFIKNVRITRSPRNDKHDDLIKKLCENLVLDAKNNEIRISAFPSIQTKYSIYCSLL
jgi:glycosyltransferase involved in cell wall biosynthesis